MKTCSNQKLVKMTVNNLDTLIYHYDQPSVEFA
jgi:hypothetical protein